MTDSLKMTRRRLRPRAETIPPELELWFAGKGPIPWCALLPGEAELVPARWKAYKAAHPKATPPADSDGIINPQKRR
jgi:hypothetical protein